MAVTATKDVGEIVAIMRRAIARVGAENSVPDAILFTYINDFYQLIMNQDVKLFDNETFYEFSTVANTDSYSIDLADLGFSAFLAPSWAAGFNLNFWTDPIFFFQKWPETTTYTATRPTDVLWHNDKLIFRAPPDAIYAIKISAYKVNAALLQSSSVIDKPYWFRYIAYGAAVDFLTDSGEVDKLQNVLAAYDRYKSIVLSRTSRQIAATKQVMRSF